MYVNIYTHKCFPLQPCKVFIYKFSAQHTGNLPILTFLLGSPVMHAGAFISLFPS